MASVFESWGLKSKDNYTSIPQLGISNSLNKLEIDSQNYFTIGENARAEDGDILGVTVRKGQTFDLNNGAHRSHLKACTQLFKDKSLALKTLDQKIAASSVLGIVATSLSFIPFVSYFGMLGWGSAVYHIAQREAIETEYKESLNLLVASCNWALGEKPENRVSLKDKLTSDEDIREMMTALYPVLTDKQAAHLIADDIEKIFIAELHEYENKYRLKSNANNFFSTNKNGDERIAQSKRGAEFSRCVYGYNKGRASDYLDAFFSVFPDICDAIHHGFKRVQHWWNNGSNKQEPATTATLNMNI